MFKINIPTYHAKSVFDIDPCFYKKHGYKIVLIDLDNTLDSYKTKYPSERAISLKERLEKEGIKLIIVSNNTGKRVSTYASALGVEYIPSIGKPFKWKLLKAVEKFRVRKEEIIMIGDQTVTDIAAANRAKIDNILTDKIVKEDQPTTHFNRMFDIPIRKKLIKKGLLREVD